MERQSRGGMNRRQSLKALMAGGAALLSPIRLTHAQGAIEAGKPLPAILVESYPDQMSVEVVRLYARELAEIGIQINHKPLGFAQILGQVYGRKEFTAALMGFGSPEERLDPDYYLRSVFATDSSFNFTGYSNAEFDRLCKLQQEETDWNKRQEAIFQAQRVWAEDVPSWHVCSRAAINPVNKRLFRNFKPSRALGLEVYHVAPYLALEPVGGQREVNVASTFRMSSAHIFTERSANGRGYLRFLYDSFLRFDGDLKLVPWAAESYAAAGPLAYDVRLRPGMKWHDGRPVTIEDAKFTIDYALKWKPPVWAPFMSPIKGADIVNPNTLRIHLNARSATFLTLSLTQIVLLPKHVWENVPEKAGVKDPMEWDAPSQGGMIGSGPFRFGSFQKDVDCYFRANREHFSGGPKVDGIHYIQASSVEQIVGGMETGSIHIVGDGLTRPDGERLAKHKDIELLVTDTGTVVSFWLDVRRPLFQDRAMRLAMYHALPKKKILDIVLGGAGSVARRSPIPPVHASWIPKDMPGDEYDLGRARKLLAEAGYKTSGGRLIMK
jgi:peptide/nickel transport system substrate-binding protein